MTDTSDPRDIAAEDVDWSMKATNKSTERPAALYVPHTNARSAAVGLDNWLGPFNWTDSYRAITVGKYPGIECTLRIRPPADDRDPLTHAGVGEWVEKQGWAEIDDDGKAELVVKGAESDAFKRAVTKAGVGRNVYRIEGIWGPGKVGNNGKIYGQDSVTLSGGEIITIAVWCSRRAGLIEGATT